MVEAQVQRKIDELNQEIFTIRDQIDDLEMEVTQIQDEINKLNDGNPKETMGLEWIPGKKPGISLDKCSVVVKSKNKDDLMELSSEKFPCKWGEIKKLKINIGDYKSEIEIEGNKYGRYFVYAIWEEIHNKPIFFDDDLEILDSMKGKEIEIKYQLGGVNCPILIFGKGIIYALAPRIEHDHNA